jgi:hypothetical protein
MILYSMGSIPNGFLTFYESEIDMTIRKLLLAGAAVMALASPALAQDGPAGGHGPMGGPMQNADTDGDGMISKAEFMAVHEKRFDEMDTNKDGKLSKDEMKAHREAMKAQFDAKRKEWEAKKKSGDAGTPPAATPAQ